MSAIRALMTNLIDYAGLFPPAKLDMAPAVREYAAHRADPYAWMLGRFICPVARLDELAAAVGDAREHGLPARSDGADATTSAWSISALIGEDLAADLDAITAFVERHNGRFDVPSLELKVADAGRIDAALRTLTTVAEEVSIFFEFPVSGDFRGFVAALSGTGYGAKIRTGGLTPDAFEPPETVARFIAACRDAGVPFKATAGLHHPVRHYSDEVRCHMHGFLNVFLAAAFADQQGFDAAALQRIIEIEDPGQFIFEDDACRVGDFSLTTDEIAESRRFAVSYGSCSFDEPVEDLKGLGLIG